MLDTLLPHRAYAVLRGKLAVPLTVRDGPGAASEGKPNITFKSPV